MYHRVVQIPSFSLPLEKAAPPILDFPAQPVSVLVLHGDIPLAQTGEPVVEGIGGRATGIDVFDIKLADKYLFTAAPAWLARHPGLN